MGLIRENKDVHGKEIAGTVLAGHVLGLSWPVLAFWLEFYFFESLIITFC